VTAVAITEILVHVDDTPAAEARIRAAVELAAASKAHVSALALITEPFMRALVGRHLPEDLVREHLATLEREADERLAALSAIAAAKGVKLETRRETAGLDHLSAILARQGRRADLIVVGPGADTDQSALTEAAFMDTGRPALVVPTEWSGTLPPKRALIAWDGSREAARATGDAVPLLQTAEDVIVLTVDAHRAGARYSDRPGFGLTTYLTRHGAKARVKQVAASGGIADTILVQVAEERADLLVMGGYGHSPMREMMFGGVTRSLLESATCPVLVSH
jgi:nucleotide-binding universal stress UspA family protein